MTGSSSTQSPSTSSPGTITSHTAGVPSQISHTNTQPETSHPSNTIQKPATNIHISTKCTPVESPQSDEQTQETLKKSSSPLLTRQQSRLSMLSLQIAQLTEETARTRASLSNPDASATIARHIKLLHDYNDIKDIGLKLMEIVAERRGVRIAEVMDEFGVGEGD